MVYQTPMIMFHCSSFVMRKSFAYVTSVTWLQINCGVKRIRKYIKYYDNRLHLSSMYKVCYYFRHLTPVSLSHRIALRFVPSLYLSLPVTSPPRSFSMQTYHAASLPCSSSRPDSAPRREFHARVRWSCGSIWSWNPSTTSLLRPTGPTSFLTATATTSVTSPALRHRGRHKNSVRLPGFYAAQSAVWSPAAVVSAEMEQCSVLCGRCRLCEMGWAASLHCSHRLASVTYHHGSNIRLRRSVLNQTVLHPDHPSTTSPQTQYGSS